MSTPIDSAADSRPDEDRNQGRSRRRWAVSGTAFTLFLGLLFAGTDTLAGVYKDFFTKKAPHLSVSTMSAVDPSLRSDEKINPARVDITIRNSGDLSAVLIGAKLRITDKQFLEPCIQGSDISEGANYSVEIPQDVTIGDTVDTKLQQKITSDDVTRFSLSYGMKFKVGDPLGVFAYVGELAIQQDGGRPDLNAGKVLISGPGDNLITNTWVPPKQNMYGKTVTRLEYVTGFLVTTKDKARSSAEYKCLLENEEKLHRLFSHGAILPPNFAKVREEME